MIHLTTPQTIESNAMAKQFLNHFQKQIDASNSFSKTKCHILHMMVQDLAKNYTTIYKIRCVDGNLMPIVDNDEWFAKYNFIGMASPLIPKFSVK